MHKKCLLLIMLFNCVVQGSESQRAIPESNKKDFSELPENLRKFRETDADARYADKMVDGAPAIDKEMKEKIESTHDTK